MINTNKLKGVIAQNEMSQTQLAKELGMAPKTFYLKMKRGVFGSDEIQQMIDLLSIENPMEIFFSKPATSKVTDS